MIPDTPRLFVYADTDSKTVWGKAVILYRYRHLQIDDSGLKWVLPLVAERLKHEIG